MALEFKEEEVNEKLIEDFKPLIKLHYDEISFYKDEIKLNPNFDSYIRLYQKNILKVYTAREGGELIGYAIFFISPNMHYQDSLQANQDILYIRPDARGFGTEFIRWCDEQLKELNVQLVLHHVKDAHNFGPKILEPLGYKLLDTVYGRIINRED